MVPAAQGIVFTSLLTLVGPASEDQTWLATVGLNTSTDYGSRAFLSKLFAKYGYNDVLSSDSSMVGVTAAIALAPLHLHLVYGGWHE